MALLTDRKFIHFNKKEDFLVLLNANAIADWQIVFIGNGNSGEEAPEIWTHGTYYGSVEQFLDETNKDSTNAISAAAVYKALTDDEKTIAAALNDLNDRIENLDIPSKVSDLTDDLSLATLGYVDDKLDDVLGVSAAGVEAFVNMTRDEDTATGILTEIVNKAPKTNAVNGAPLSNTESYFYGTSTTAADTALKEVSIPSITSLKTGQIIVVKPTITSTVANSTIKLNNFTAYPMRYNNTAITTSTDSIVWAANIPSIWVFDGTYWVFLGHGLDSNTTYSGMTQAEVTAGTSTTNRLISPKLLRDNFYTETECDTNFAKVPLVIEVNDTDTTVPSGTYASITAALAAGRDVVVKVTLTDDVYQIFNCRIITDDSTEGIYTFGYCNGNDFARCDIDNTNNLTIDINQLGAIYASDSHIHGNIQPTGTLLSDITISNGDKLVITDADSVPANKIARASLSFDGSTTTKALTPKGTWETFLKTAPVTSVNNQTGAVTLALGDTNVIETVKVNGTALTPDANKAVDVLVKTIDGNDITGSGDLTVFPLIEYADLNSLEDVGIYRVGTGYICLCTLSGPSGSPFYSQTLYGSGGNIQARSGNSLPLTSPWTTLEQSIKSLNTNNTSAQTVNASEAIAGTGTINLHKVSKTGSYSDLIKPSTGIPKTDLANAVQTSLGKADSAIQGVKVNGTSVTPDSNKIVDITIPEGELSTNYEPSSLDNEDLALAAGDTYEEAFGKLEKSINDNEQITAAALTDLDSRINTLHLPQSLDDIPDGSTRKLSDYATTTLLATKQDALVSGTNIKTINNESILGSGNITIQGGSGGDTNVIETVKVNGTALTPDSNKAVDIDLTSYYQKPSTGIPSNDLNSAVNTSLSRADNAYLRTFYVRYDDSTESPTRYGRGVYLDTAQKVVLMPLACMTLQTAGQLSESLIFFGDFEH